MYILAVGKLLDFFQFNLPILALDGSQTPLAARCVGLYMYGHFPHEGLEAGKYKSTQVAQRNK